MRFKKSLTFTFFLLFCSISFSQTTTSFTKKDSVLYYLKNPRDGYRLHDFKRAADIAHEIQHDSLIRIANNKYGLECFFNKEPLGLNVAQENLMQLFAKNQDSFALAKVYHYKALIQLLNFKKDSALYYYVESKNVSALIKDSLEVGRRLLSMANQQRLGNDYIGSEISAVEGLSYLEPINDYRYTGNLYNNLGILFKNTNQFSKARDYFNKATNKHKKNPNKERKEIASLNILNNIGNTYVAEKKYDEAITYFKKGLEFDSLAIKYPIQYYMLLENLSDSYRRIQNYDKAIEGLLTSLKLKEEKKDYRRLSTTHNLLSIYYRDVNQHQKSLYHVRKGLEYAKKTKFILREVEALQLLSNSKLVSQKEANTYLKRYIRLNDSLIQQERIIKNQFATIRYETGKKEKENADLKIENERKQLQIEQERQEKIISWLISIGAILLLASSIIFFKYRRKKQVFEAQLQKAEAREHERQLIAKSLHDEVAGDLRVLHQKLAQTNQSEFAESLNTVKDNVRNLSHQLSSVRFEEVSFQDQMINLMSDYFALDFRIAIKGLKEIDWKPIKNPIKRTLYLSSRECLQNAKKYAQADKITIEFKQDKNTLYLTVTDNGIGFDVATASGGIGLKNQRERVEELNGKIEIISAKDKGTMTQIEIPTNV